MVVFKVFSTCKTIFKVDIKSQILPELISLWCLYYNIWTPFYLLLCTWRVTSSRPEEFYEKGTVKYSTNSQENICAGVSFATAGWRSLATSLKSESGTGAFLWIFWSLYKNVYFANVCEGMPLKSKIFTRVSLPKILSFYFEGTPS